MAQKHDTPNEPNAIRDFTKLLMQESAQTTSEKIQTQAAQVMGNAIDDMLHMIYISASATAQSLPTQDMHIKIAAQVRTLMTEASKDVQRIIGIENNPRKQTLSGLEGVEVSGEQAHAYMRMWVRFVCKRGAQLIEDALEETNGEA